MRHLHGYRRRRQAIFGICLIAVGVAFFLDPVEPFPLLRLWHYWPLLLVATGAVRVLTFASARDITSGLWSIGIGTWLYLHLDSVIDLDWRSTWPFIVIAWGVSLVLTPLIARYTDTKEQQP